MAAILAERERVDEETTKWVWPHPLTFEEFLGLYMGSDENVELVDGVVVERRMVQWDHERLLMWLLRLLGDLAEDHDLGIVVGSRTAVEITNFKGRLPDLLFVGKSRLDVIQQKAIHSPPDLVIEIMSPGDRPSDMRALESDYRLIEVPEIVFVDQRKKTVRHLFKQSDGYKEQDVTSGVLTLETMSGFTIPLEWLFSDNRPTVRKALEMKADSL